MPPPLSKNNMLGSRTTFVSLENVHYLSLSLPRLLFPIHTHETQSNSRKTSQSPNRTQWIQTYLLRIRSCYVLSSRAPKRQKIKLVNDKPDAELKAALANGAVATNLTTSFTDGALLSLKISEV